MKTPGLVPGFFYVLIYKYGPMIVIPSNGIDQGDPAQGDHA
jgi:hypothetical protein